MEIFLREALYLITDGYIFLPFFPHFYQYKFIVIPSLDEIFLLNCVDIFCVDICKNAPEARFPMGWE